MCAYVIRDNMNMNGICLLHYVKCLKTLYDNMVKIIHINYNTNYKLVFLFKVIKLRLRKLFEKYNLPFFFFF